MGGGADRAAGDADAAASALEEAARIAEQLGAAPLLQEARAVARAARMRLDGDAPARTDDPFGLTEREREVLALVARQRGRAQQTGTLATRWRLASMTSMLPRRLGPP